MAGKMNLFTPALLDVNAPAAEIATGRSAAPILIPKPQQRESKSMSVTLKPVAQKESAGSIAVPVNANGQTYVVVRTGSEDWASIFWIMGDLAFTAADRRSVFMSAGTLKEMLVSALRLKANGAQIEFAVIEKLDGGQIPDKVDWKQVDVFDLA
jgi:hypothetical protein